MKKYIINWHAALVSALQIELDAYQDILSYEKEFTLNTQPRRIDCLITKQPGSPPVPSPIAAIFRHYNLIDYKSPHESMTVTNFYKAVSYACSLPDFLDDPSVAENLTLSLVTHKYPRKLIKYLNTKFPNSLEKIMPGLYSIHINLFPMQLIVLRKLPPEEYLWLHCLTNHLTPATPIHALHDVYALHSEEEKYKTFMNAFILANLREKGSVASMCEAFYELFKDELIAREQNGLKRGEELGLKRGQELGLKRGQELGQKLGQESMAALILRLISDNRAADIEEAAANPEFRAALMQQYQLQ